MMQSEGFTLQGRTVAVNESASGSATQFSAFAFGTPNATVEVCFSSLLYYSGTTSYCNTSMYFHGPELYQFLPVQVQIQNVTGLLLLLDSKDITGFIPNVTDTYTNNSFVSFERVGQTSILSTFSNGVSITVSLSLGILTSVVTLPMDLQNKVSGLLGNFNDDSTDDLIYPNGTSLSSGASDMMIHYFGQACKL